MQPFAKFTVKSWNKSEHNLSFKKFPGFRIVLKIYLMPMSCPEKYFSFDKGITYNIKGSNAEESDLCTPTTLRMPVCLCTAVCPEATVLLPDNDDVGTLVSLTWDAGCHVAHGAVKKQGLRRWEERHLHDKRQILFLVPSLQVQAWAWHTHIHYEEKF